MEFIENGTKINISFMNLKNNMHWSKNKKIILFCILSGISIIFIIWLFHNFFYKREIWYQNYSPIPKHPFLTVLLAISPPVVLFGMMVLTKIRTSYASLISLLSAFLISVIIWQMPPQLAISSVFYGAANAIFPILWTLSNAMWILNMLIKSGRFETLKESLKNTSDDRRMQTILVGFGLTALLESMAAFGAPIAVITPMLIGLGFSPYLSATIALIADSAPSAWGTQSLPIIMLSSVTNINIETLGEIISHQAPLISALLPAALVFIMSGWKGLFSIFPIPFIIGATYWMVAIFTARYLSVSAVGVLSAVSAIMVTLIINKIWKPKHSWIFPEEKEILIEKNTPKNKAATFQIDTIRSWSPYIILILIIGITNISGIKNFLNSLGSAEFAWPFLDNLVMKISPVVPIPTVYPAIYKQNLFTNGGTLMFIAGILSIFTLKLSPKQAFHCFIKTWKEIMEPGIAMVCILGIAYLMNYSSMTYSIGLILASAGKTIFPAISVLLGVLGCILTGSVAGSNALFGNLTVVVAQQLGLNPSFIAASLCSGGTMGKTLTPQNLIIAGTAIGKNYSRIEKKLIYRVSVMTAFFIILLIVLILFQYRYSFV